MLQPPELIDDALVELLDRAFRLRLTELDFLPLGADPRAAAYRATNAGGARYFVKLRRGPLSDCALALPGYLHRLGATGVVGPLETNDGRRSALFGDWSVVLYPFIDGSSAASVTLTPDQWHRLGAMVKLLHTAPLGSELAREIGRERYAGAERGRVRAIAAGSVEPAVDDPLAGRLAALVRERRGQIEALVARAAGGADALRGESSDWVVTHGDLYAANVLVGRNGQVFVVDWDQPLVAPIERDLMFVGGGMGYLGYPPHEEAALFYHGYGPVDLDPRALAYFRQERIVQDIAAFADEITSATLGATDRRQSLEHLEAIFDPGGGLDLALQT